MEPRVCLQIVQEAWCSAPQWDGHAERQISTVCIQRLSGCESFSPQWRSWNPVQHLTPPREAWRLSLSCNTQPLPPPVLRFLRQVFVSNKTLLWFHRPSSSWRSCSPLKVAALDANPLLLYALVTRSIPFTSVTIIYIFTLPLHSQTRGPRAGHCRKTKVKGWPLPYRIHILSHYFSFLPSDCQVQLCVHLRSLSFFFFQDLKDLLQ